MREEFGLMPKIAVSTPQAIRFAFRIKCNNTHTKPADEPLKQYVFYPEVSFDIGKGEG